MNYINYIPEPVLIAKSNIILDVKPWDDETDMVAMEKVVREIATDGLLWGAAKLVPLAYGIHKLQISCVVEDDKVSIDWLTEEIEKLEDFVSEHLLNIFIKSCSQDISGLYMWTFKFNCLLDTS